MIKHKVIKKVINVRLIAFFLFTVKHFFYNALNSGILSSTFDFK